MTVAAVDIANAALAKLVQDETISSLTDRDKAAVLFNANFDRVRDTLLAEHAWPFATRAVALSLQTEAPLPGWTYRYRYPADCVKALAVCDANGIRGGVAVAQQWWGTDRWQQYVLGLPAWDTCAGAVGPAIVTDQPTAYLIYVQRVTDFDWWPVLAREALACLFAQELGPALIGQTGLQLESTLLQKYQYALAKAIAHGLNESREIIEPMTPSLQVRQ